MSRFSVLGADYMESFNPGVDISTRGRAEKLSRLHGYFSTGLKYFNSGRAEIIRIQTKILANQNAE